MIPEDRRIVVSRAVRDSLGAAVIEAMEPVTGGHSGALIYRMVVAGKPYLLRLIMRNPDVTIGDHFHCLRAAAAAGLAPPVIYCSEEDRLAITGFVAARRLSMEEAAARVPGVLRRLHALVPFPERADALNTTSTYLLAREVAWPGLVERVQSGRYLTGGEELWERLEQIAAVYPRLEADRVASHNDLFKPDNILFDGERIWLVDWEAAFRNDRYADLAATANLMVNGETEERAFLEAYWGRPASGYERARLLLMRQLTHIFYAMAFQMLGAMAGGGEAAGPLPSYAEMRRRIWAGELDMAVPKWKTIYGRVQMARVTESVSRAAFGEAVRMVAGGS